MKARLLHLIGTALVVAAGVLVVAGQAQAAIGSYRPVQATCEYGRVTVTSPQMSPAYDYAIGPNGELIADPPQWVAFRPHLAKWNGSRWVIVASGDWKAARATESMGTGLSDTWLNLRTNRWEAGTTTFSVGSTGYYTVWAEYYWYAQYSVTAGYVGLTKTPYHADLMSGSYMGWGDPYCHYR